MKRIFRVFLFFILTVFLSVLSCQHDDSVDHTHQSNTQKSEFIIQIESGKHFQDFNSTVYKKLKQTSQSVASASIGKNDSNGNTFSLNLNTIQIIERNTYTQYTTPVIGHKDQETHLINYMLIEFDDGAEYQFLIKYPRIINNQVESLDHANAVMEAINGETILNKSGIGSPRPCLEGVPEIVDSVQQYICTETPCTGDEHHTWGEECECVDLSYCTMPTRSCGWQTVNVWGCSGGGTSTGSGSDPTADGGSNPPNDTDPDDPIETVPFVPNWERVVNCINGGAMGSFDNSLPLSSDDISWLQTPTGSVYADAIVNLNTNPCEENKEFIDEAIEALRNNGEVDFEEKIILDPSFTGKAKCIYN
ncbi:MAG: hypothetical protein AB8B65_08115 [Kordia sp.]|uniref:hypothetical protein n=1 Tax=Kordia sp. TaxID=1965332 RepID=UPI00385C5089